MSSLEVIEMDTEYIEKRIEQKGSVFGGQKVKNLPKEDRLEKVVQLMSLVKRLKLIRKSNDRSFL